jgi:hypothetical protein
MVRRKIIIGKNKVVQIMAARKHRERPGGRTIYSPQGQVPNDLLALARSYLLKFPKPLETAPPVGD